MNGRKIEWPTLGLLVMCYALWAFATTWLAETLLPAAILLTGLTITLYASLCHEIIHGHPCAWHRLNAALVFPSLTVFIPFGRFRDTHLDHHRDANLTDPYDDPETQFLDPASWARLPRAVQILLNANNTLAGRLTIGPLIGQIAFMAGDIRLARAGDTRVVRSWLWHGPALVPVFIWLTWTGTMPIWAYLIAAYFGLAVLKIRTFLEHQAHKHARGRTVIIEDRGPLALMFLNNNLHTVHHMHPRVPWYRLPGLYYPNRASYLARNDGYHYNSYGEIFARHFWRRKDPVPHPLWTQKR